MDNSSRYFLNSITYYGALKKSKALLQYIPLHGDVVNTDSYLYFGKFDLALVDKKNVDLFNVMFAKLIESPTLFWGYGLHDSGVLKCVAHVLERKAQNFWIQCLPGSSNIELYRRAGCLIIEGNTEELLTWIKENVTLPIADPTHKSIAVNKVLEPYRIPTINQVEAVPAIDYYSNASTHWYNILANHAYETTYVNYLYDQSLAHKNIIVLGMSFSGKTTLLMQLANKMNEENKLYVSELTPEQARYLLKYLNGSQATVFMDNCADDIITYKIFAESSNIRILGFTDDFVFESCKHLIDGIDYKQIEIGDLSKFEAQQIFDKIPAPIRTEEFHYKEDDSEKYSMLEMLSNNVNEFITINQIRTILNKIRRSLSFGFDLIAVTSYLTVNRSALSVDTLMAYFDTKKYDAIVDMVSQVKTLLADANITLSIDDVDQDYYNLRSNLFARYTNQVLLWDFKKEYGEVIRRFIYEVSPLKIYKYYVFKRRAYDANLFYKVFGKDAHELYETLYLYDNSAYVLQQWALYKSRLEDYAGAFADIDKASNMLPYNFSIKNARAIIYFEANKNKSSETAIKGMKKAMEILEECYNNDKRKVYHAQKYAEFALYFYSKLNDKQFIKPAIAWMDNLEKRGEVIGNWTKKLRLRLKKADTV